MRNPFSHEYFIGYVNQVTPEYVKVHFPSSSLLHPFMHKGECYNGGLVGNYVVIEGYKCGFLGKIQELVLPEKERLELSEKSFQTNDFHPLGNIEILLSFDLLDPKNTDNGLNSLPPIGSKVFVCSSELLKDYFKNFGVKKEQIGNAPTINLGVLTQDMSTTIDISQQALFGRHCAIVGTTGGGKSYTVSTLIEGIKDNKGKVIVLDPTGEYAVHDGKEYAAEATILARNSYFHYTRMTIGDWYVLFRPSGQVQQPLLLEAIRSLKLIECFNVNNVIPSSYENETKKYSISGNPADGFVVVEKGNIRKNGNFTKTFNNYTALYNESIDNIDSSEFDINKLCVQLRNECCTIRDGKWDNNEDKRSLDNISSLVIRIYNVLKNKDFIKIFGFDKDKEHDICEKIESFLVSPDKHLLRIGFEDVPYSFQAREILANAIAKLLLNKARDGEFKDSPLVLFVDEAHQYINKAVKDEYFEATKLDAFDLIAKECRKYGLFLCLATQMPRDIPSGTLSQMGAFIVHRLINHFDKEAIESACSSANKTTLSYLPILGAGEAILMGVNFPMPVMLKIHKPKVEPNSSTPQFKK